MVGSPLSSPERLKPQARPGGGEAGAGEARGPTGPFPDRQVFAWVI